MTTLPDELIYIVSCVCYPFGVQVDEGPIRFHPHPNGPLQADSLTNLEAL